MKVFRDIAFHQLTFVISEGQGGAVVAVLAKPTAVENVLLARNVRSEEGREIDRAWGSLKLLVAERPRLGTAKPGTELLLEAYPELLEPCPVSDLPLLAIVPPWTPRREEITEFAASVKASVLKGMDDVVWSSWVDRAKREIWEHSVSCICGKRTMLFGQCFRCMPEEENELNRAEKENGEDPALVISVLKVIPGPRVPDLTVSGLRE